MNTLPFALSCFLGLKHCKPISCIVPLNQERKTKTKNDAGIGLEMMEVRDVNCLIPS